MPQFVKVATTEEMSAQPVKLVEVAGQKVALFCIDGTCYAIADTCTHKGGPLSRGLLEGTTVTCPWHRAKFDIRTGAVQGPPARMEVKSYPVRITGADIEVEV